MHSARDDAEGNRWDGETLLTRRLDGDRVVRILVLDLVADKVSVSVEQMNFFLPVHSVHKIGHAPVDLLPGEPTFLLLTEHVSSFRFRCRAADYGGGAMPCRTVVPLCVPDVFVSILPVRLPRVCPEKALDRLQSPFVPRRELFRGIAPGVEMLESADIAVRVAKCLELIHHGEADTPETLRSGGCIGRRCGVGALSRSGGPGSSGRA